MTAATPPGDTAHPPKAAELSLAQRFCRRMYHADQAREPAWGVLRRWRPGDVNADVLDVTRDGDDTQWPYLAIVGSAISIHGSASSGYGGLADELRRCKDASGNYGPNNTAAANALRTLLAADTIDGLHQAITSATRVLRRHDRRPNWEQVVDETLTWADPVTRDSQRTAWGRDFFTYTPPTSN